MAAHPDTVQHDPPVKLADLRELIGDIDEMAAAAIIATGATRAELEQAVFYARGYGDVVNRSGHPLVGAAAQTYEILIADEDDEDSRR
jgi:hypothetical protein